MPKEIEFTKYKERGAYHWQESKRSIFKFNASQEAKFERVLRCLGDIKGKIVLDVGCGDGALTYRIVQKGANVIGIDNSGEGIKLAKEIFNKKKASARFILADAYQLPIEASSIDCVVLSEVIEHVAEPEKMLLEVQRVLKPNGKVVVSTSYRRSETPWDKLHFKEYEPAELKFLLAQYFSDVKIIQTHPAFWMYLYAYVAPFYWLINIAALYFKFNPLLKDDSHRRRLDYFFHITATAFKK